MTDELTRPAQILSLVFLYVIPIIGIALAWWNRNRDRWALVRGGAIGGAIGGVGYVVFWLIASPELGWLVLNAGAGHILWGAILGLMATGLRMLTDRRHSAY